MQCRHTDLTGAMNISAPYPWNGVTALLPFLSLALHLSVCLISDLNRRHPFQLRPKEVKNLFIQSVSCWHIVIFINLYLWSESKHYFLFAVKFCDKVLTLYVCTANLNIIPVSFAVKNSKLSRTRLLANQKSYVIHATHRSDHKY